MTLESEHDNPNDIRTKLAQHVQVVEVISQVTFAPTGKGGTTHIDDADAYTAS